MNQLEGFIFWVFGKENSEKTTKMHFHTCIHFILLQGEKLKEKNLQSKTEQKYANPNTERANKSNSFLFAELVFLHRQSLQV